MRLDGQKTKILELKQLLQQETDADHGLTMAQIIAKLAERGVRAERKSIYSDFEALRRYGVDVIGPSGKDRTYAIAEREFEPAELRMLVDVIQSAKFLSQAETRRLIGKVSGLTSRHEAKRLNRSVTVINRVKSMNNSVFATVDTIQSAIQDNRCVTFRYYSHLPQGNKRYHHDGEAYLISPWTLVYQQDKYYLIGDENGMTKHFRVDRMDDVQISDIPRSEQTEFDAAQVAGYTKICFRMFNGPVERVTMVLHSSLMGTVRDHFGSDVFVTQTVPDRFLITVPVAVSPQFFGWVFGLGKGIRIVEPKSVVSAYRDYLGEVAAQYGE